MEKERDLADAKSYTSPIHVDKVSADQDFNDALEFRVDSVDKIPIVAGSHNDESCLIISKLIALRNIPKNHPHLYFAQLFGMGDSLSFNLAYAGYNVAKDVPYGLLHAVLPYLFRRAEENCSIAGSTGRKLKIIENERRRRQSVGL
jgi:proline dehydrogenase